jgi:hypothetical protein
MMSLCKEASILPDLDPEVHAVHYMALMQFGVVNGDYGNDEFAVPFQPHKDFLRIFDSILIFQ